MVSSLSSITLNKNQILHICLFVTSLAHGFGIFHRKMPVCLIPPEAKRGVLKFCIGIGRDITLDSVTSFSSHTSDVKGRKFGLHNFQMDGSKVPNQIFYILPRAEIFKFKVTL